MITPRLGMTALKFRVAEFARIPAVSPRGRLSASPRNPAISATSRPMPQLQRLTAATLLFFLALTAGAAEPAVRRLPVKQYREHMQAGWIGQIIGVSWGAPTEGRYHTIMPADKMPPFSEDLINQAFGQDDLYVEMTFLRSLEQYGWDVSIRQAGIDFANSGYPLWVANDAGRRNLRNGIAPPDSSHPQFHNCAGAIDYQIEADYAGLIAPGMPDVVIALGEKFGRLMNYGDGMYAGQFIGVLYAEAFFEKDVHKLIAAGLRAIPAECLYAEMVRDMVRWRKENPDWEKTWALAEQKYNKDRNYNISALDVKREGAWVLMGLLYGAGDLDQTITISCRCGFDSDCNPSSSGGILATSRGLANLPERYYRKLNEKAIFSHTAYTFPALIDVSEKLARQALAKAGGRIEKNAAGEEVFVIPVKGPTPSRFENLKQPGPIAGSLFTDEEMAQIKTPGLKWALPKKYPGWDLLPANRAGGAFAWERGGKKNVLELKAPDNNDAGWTLARKLELPAGGKSRLTLAASGDKNRAWSLVIKADGRELLQKTIAPDAAPGGWVNVSVDLPAPAGRTVALEVVGTPPGPKNRPPCYVADLAVAPR
jgi:hypothetical protein